MDEIVAAVKKIDKTIAKKKSEFEIVKSTYFLKPYPFSLKRVQFINDYKTEIDRLNRKRRNLFRTMELNSDKNSEQISNYTNLLQIVDTIEADLANSLLRLNKGENPRIGLEEVFDGMHTLGATLRSKIDYLMRS